MPFSSDFSATLFNFGVFRSAETSEGTVSSIRGLSNRSTVGDTIEEKVSHVELVDGTGDASGVETPEVDEVELL